MVCAVVALAAQAGLAATYDLTADFSAEQNPNGVWSYGWSESRGSEFHLSTTQAENFCYGHVVGWLLPRGRSWVEPLISPLYAVTDWIHPSNFVPKDTVSVHPGPLGENCVIRWTAPARGTYEIHGWFRGNDFVGPTSTDVAVLHGAREIFTGGIYSYNVPLDFSLTEMVNVGETIDFTVGYGTDGTYEFDSTGINVTITGGDMEPPTISSVTASPNVLWPANHKMVPVSVGVVASDDVGVASCRIISVTSSEPDNGLGDGDTAGDSQITGDLSLLLRAERSGKGNGRTYTITVECKDEAGNTSTGTTTVTVPRDQGKK